MNSPTPMRAMIWKEFRENLKWAALGFLITTGTVIFVLYNHANSGPGTSHTYMGIGSPLMHDDFQVTTVVNSGLVALMLALAQVFPEKRADQWAFLVHRPVPRTQLFLAKVIAGLTLYLLAVGIPFAGAIVRVAAAPGAVPAPFVPEMALPTVADVLAGIMYYFAGLVVSLREARWYGSRIMAAGLAVLASFVVVLGLEFWWALIAIAVAVSILATAAWGCFLTAGRYDRQPMPAKASLGAAVMVGILILGGFAVAIVGHLAFDSYGPQEVRTFSTYTLDGDGVPVRVNYVNSKIDSITDPDGNPIPKYAGASKTKEFRELGGRMIGANLWLEAPGWPWRERSYRRAERFYADVDSWDQYSTEQRWYFVHDKGYIVAYDPRDRQIAGYASPAGFTSVDAGPPTTHFEGPMLQNNNNNWPRHILAFSSGAYSMDYQHKTVTPVFIAPAGEKLIALNFAQTQPPNNAPAVTHFLAFATDRSLYVQSADRKLIYSTPIENGSNANVRYVTVNRDLKGTRNVLWYLRKVGSNGRKNTQAVVQLTPTGEVVSQQELPPLPRMKGPQRYLAESIYAGTVAPAFMLTTGALISWADDSPFDADQLKSMIVANAIAALLCIAVTIALGRRHAFSRRRIIGWSIAMIFFGPAGLLLLISLASWRAREKCPACGRGRVVSKEHCPNCGAEFSLPPLDGTEIFAT